MRAPLLVVTSLTLLLTIKKTQAGDTPAPAAAVAGTVHLVFTEGYHRYLALCLTLSVSQSVS